MPRPRSSANMAMPKPPSPASPRRPASRRARSTIISKTARNCSISCCRRSASTWCDFIRERTGTAHAARQEIERFGAFFDFIREVPEFLRILNEAEFFAPIGYQKHLDNISTAYVRILQRARVCRRDRRFQRRGIRGHRPHVDGRARLSQPPLFLFRRQRHRRARPRHLRLPKAGHARAVQHAGQRQWP